MFGYVSTTMDLIVKCELQLQCAPKKIIFGTFGLFQDFSQFTFLIKIFIKNCSAGSSLAVSSSWSINRIEIDKYLNYYLIFRRPIEGELYA